MARGAFPLLVGAALAAAGAAAGASASLYTDAQAEAGAALYAGRCAMCHGRRLEGTFEIPGLQGRFIANWSGAPLGDLYDYLGRAMPQFAPGTLSAEDNALILAFLLRSNAIPAGAEPLPANSAALQRIILDPSPNRSMSKEK